MPTAGRSLLGAVRESAGGDFHPVCNDRVRFSFFFFFFFQLRGPGTPQLVEPLGAKQPDPKADKDAPEACGHARGGLCHAFSIWRDFKRSGYLKGAHWWVGVEETSANSKVSGEPFRPRPSA